MAFGDKFKDWWGSWGDDDYYEDESSFDDDLWADLGIDPDSDPDTWFDETPTDDPYGIGSFFDDTYNFGDWGGDDDSWDTPTGTVNPWEDDTGDELLGWLLGKDPDADPYGIGESYGGVFGDDSYLDKYTDLSLDDLLNFGNYQDYYDYTDDPYGVGEGYGDAFDFGDNDDNAFNEFLSNFDFAGDADWAGGIGDLFGYDDPDDPYGIGAGYDNAFGDSDGNLSIDDLISLYGTGETQTGGGGIGGSNFPAWGHDATGANDTGANDTGAGDTGIFGGKWGPWLRNLFLGSGGTGDTGDTGDTGSGLGGLLGWLLKGRQGQTGSGGLFGGSGLEKLLKLGAINQLRKQDSNDPADVVPIGADAFSAVGQGGEGSPIDYRVFNLQPALMPGVAYANVGKPEGMKYGGSVYPSVNPVIPRPPFDPRRHWTPPEPKKERGYGQAQEGLGGYASGGPVYYSVEHGGRWGYQKNKPKPKKERGYGQAQEGRGGMKDGGLGDVTLAKLEPGEFVITKKAVDNIGAKNLYKMMKQAEGMG